MKHERGLIAELATKPIDIPRPYYVLSGIGAIIFATLHVLLIILLLPFDLLARIGWNATRMKE